MPVVHELFGKALTKSGARKVKFRKAQCPHMDGKQCDGGGNRDMARWPAEDQPLVPFFDKSVGPYIPCGVCSVSIDQQSWAVCPRRLLTFDASKPSPQQHHLLERVLYLAGFRSGEVVRVWSEKTISSRKQDRKLHYRLDYVLKTQNSAPVIVEIMTASTSGGNKQKKTDIKNAFCNAVLYAVGTVGKLGQSPNVNVRQVWARMASQMIVKSQIANKWGGKAIWVVQDSLVDYIRRTTGLRIDDMYSPSWTAKEVNVVAASLEDPNDVRLYSGPVTSRKGEACWAELLNTPLLPDVDILQDKLETGDAIAEFRI